MPNKHHNKFHKDWKDQYNESYFQRSTLLSIYWGLRKYSTQVTAHTHPALVTQHLSLELSTLQHEGFSY